MQVCLPVTSRNQRRECAQANDATLTRPIDASFLRVPSNDSPTSWPPTTPPLPGQRPFLVSR